MGKRAAVQGRPSALVRACAANTHQNPWSLKIQGKRWLWKWARKRGQLFWTYRGLFRKCLPRAKLLKKRAWFLQLIGDKAPLATRDSNAVARVLTRRCYPNSGNREHSCCLNSKLSLSLRFPLTTKPWILPDARHRGLTTIRALFTCSLNWELKREHGIYGTSSQA